MDRNQSKERPPKVGGAQVVDPSDFGGHDIDDVVLQQSIYDQDLLNEGRKSTLSNKLENQSEYLGASPTPMQLTEYDHPKMERVQTEKQLVQHHLREKSPEVIRKAPIFLQDQIQEEQPNVISQEEDDEDFDPEVPDDPEPMVIPQALDQETLPQTAEGGEPEVQTEQEKEKEQEVPQPDEQETSPAKEEELEKEQVPFELAKDQVVVHEEEQPETPKVAATPGEELDNAPQKLPEEPLLKYIEEEDYSRKNEEQSVEPLAEGGQENFQPDQEASPKDVAEGQERPPSGQAEPSRPEEKPVEEKVREVQPIAEPEATKEEPAQEATSAQETRMPPVQEASRAAQEEDLQEDDLPSMVKENVEPETPKAKSKKGKAVAKPSSGGGKKKAKRNDTVSPMKASKKQDVPAKEAAPAPKASPKASTVKKDAKKTAKEPQTPSMKPSATTKTLATLDTVQQSSPRRADARKRPQTPDKRKKAQDAPASPNPNDHTETQSPAKIDDGMSQMSYSRKSIGRSSIARGSMAFKKKGTMGEGSDAGSLKIENDKLLQTINILNQKLKAASESDAQIVKLRQKLKESEEKNQKGFKDIMGLKGDITNLTNNIAMLNSQITQLDSTVASLNATIEEKDREIDKHMDTQSQLKAEIEGQNGSMQNQSEEMFALKQELHTTTVNLNQTTNNLEETTADYKESSRQLINAQQKIGDLMQNVEDLVRTEQTYIGHKYDKIDCVLEHYITNYPEKERMKILFLRESEGVYQFGQKRVYLKVEKGNTIKVRVGGGFMNIDDFIDQYTEQEVAKIERNDVFQKFQNKLQVQQFTLDSVHQNELSPVREVRRARSPKKLGRRPSMSPKKRMMNTMESQSNSSGMGITRGSMPQNWETVKLQSKNRKSKI